MDTTGCTCKLNVPAALLMHEHWGNLSLLPVSLVCCCLTVFFFLLFLCIAPQLFLLLHLHVWAACCHRSIVLSASPFYCKRISDFPLRCTHTHTHSHVCTAIFVRTSVDIMHSVAPHPSHHYPYPHLRISQNVLTSSITFS